MGVLGRSGLRSSVSLPQSLTALLLLESLGTFAAALAFLRSKNSRRISCRLVSSGVVGGAGLAVGEGGGCVQLT